MFNQSNPREEFVIKKSSSEDEQVGECQNGLVIRSEGGKL